jgi:hypothetical protein
MNGNARDLSKKMGLIGSGIGVVMFFIYGLLQGALLGGTAGIQAGSYLFTDSDLAPRVLAGGGMVLGAVLAAIIFVTGGFATGRVVGYMMGLLANREERAPSAVRN